MDPTCGLLDKFRDLVLDQIWEQLRYLVHYHRNIEQLNRRLKELIHERSSIQHQIDEARNNGYGIEEKVINWLLKVDEIAKQAEQLHEVSQAQTECSITSCPNLWLRYKLSKKAKEMTQQVVEIHGKGNFNSVSYRVPPPSMLGLTTKVSSEGIRSRVQIKSQIIEALRNPSVNMVGLCGLGGVGKTTIAKDVAMEEEIQKMFKTMIMATVSQDMNIDKIQDQIIEKLDMQLKVRTEEVKASRLHDRLKQEKNMLLILDDLWEELDLVVKVGIPFADVEKYSKENEGCKILLTSRNEALLSHRMKCQKIIKVGVLSKDEAWELFKSTAKLSIESSSCDLKSIAKEIVQMCGGLPLAIATATKALKDENIDGWKDYLARLKNPNPNPLTRSFTGIKEVDTILKLSYDDLSKENKDIFLLAAMLSHDPSIEDLLMHSVGLDILKHADNMEKAYIGISKVVSKLKSLNLFLDSSFSRRHFTIHDVFRDLALSIASVELKAVIVRHGRLDEWPDEDKLEHCRGICLQESDINDLPKELHVPILEFFLLNSTKRDLTVPNMFFNYSKQLKLLVFTNLHFPLLPSLSDLQKLKALCLHSCVLEDITEVGRLRKLKVLSLANSEIERLPVELDKLTSLQMLNVSHCPKLKVIPQNLLSRLKKLEVMYMGNSFDQWKVEGSSDDEAGGNASLDELTDLPISFLDIQIPYFSMLPVNLFLKMELKRYRIFIGKRWKWKGDYETSKILKLELERSNDLTAGIRKLLEGVQDLDLYGSNGHENILHSHVVRGFSCLKHLQIEGDHDIKYIVLNSAQHEDAFPNLESLKLKNLKALEKLCEGPDVVKFRQLHSLEMDSLHALTGDICMKDRGTNNTFNKIFKSLFNKVFLPKLEILKLSNLNRSVSLVWDDQLPHDSFGNLKTLSVKNCGFEKLIPLHMLKSLNNLEELEVSECERLEMVFDFEDFNDYKDMDPSSVVVPLRKLDLSNLPKLKNVCSINHRQGNVSFPNPGSVDISYCKSLTGDLCIKDGATNNDCNKISKSLFNKVLFPKLEILKLSNLNRWIALIWDHQLSHNSFSNLKTLIVESCGFVKLVPLHVLKCLKNLEKLEVGVCDMLESVFDFEDLNDYEEIVPSSVITPLKKLKLFSLPKLKNVWSNYHRGNVSFPSLRSVYVAVCESLTNIFPASIAKDMLCDLEEL